MLKKNSREDGPELPIPKFTLLHTSRFLYLQRLFAGVKAIEGDVVECGVARGVTLLGFAMLCFDEACHRRLWGFDSFEGFPEPGKEDESVRGSKKGDLNVSSVPAILKLLDSAGLPEPWVRSHVTLVRGFFSETLHKYTGDKIALLHVDVDLYQSYKDVLEQLYDKVVPGGVVAFDEYMNTLEHEKFPGAKAAIDEFFAERHVSIQRDVASGKYFLIKPQS